MTRDHVRYPNYLQPTLENENRWHKESLLIHDAMDALINTIRDNRVHELPTLTNKTAADHPTSTAGQQSVEEIIWLALMTIKQMHDLVRRNLKP